MRAYTIVETLEDGRIYAIVERDDGSTFGQLVEARGCIDDAELEAKIREAVATTEAIEAALARVQQAPPLDLRTRIGVRRDVPADAGRSS